MTKHNLGKRKTASHQFQYLGMMVVLLEVLILLLFLLGFGENEPGSKFVVALFAIPPALQFLGLQLLKDVFLKSFYSLLSLFWSGFYFVSLLYYMFETKPGAYSGWVCIVASAGLVGLAFSLTSATFRDNEEAVGNSIVSRVAASVGTSPSGEILLFLAFFISIGYLLGFALAFHDRNLTTQGFLPGLIAESMPGRDGAYSPQRAEHPETHQDDRSDKRWEIFFNAASAKVEVDDPASALQPGRERSELAERNRTTLSEIKNELLRSDGQPVRITLIAHSDETRLAGSPHYQSNYELAEARANNVKATLVDILSKNTVAAWSNIEWLVVPLPEPSSSRSHEDSKNQRAVEVLVRPLPQGVGLSARPQIRLLTLLEHIYFSMYTITTTGYGDIKPSTPYAMFVCTLENLYEVFFMVVFFNVLLSPKARARRWKAADTIPKGESVIEVPLDQHSEAERPSQARPVVHSESVEGESQPRPHSIQNNKRGKTKTGKGIKGRRPLP